MTSSQNNSPKSSQFPKKTYSTPQVQIYGDLREITRSVGGSMSADGGGSTSSGMNRTS
jgi:hypothetical protein